MAFNIDDIVALRKIGDNVFETVGTPLAMGDARGIAFGGCVSSMCVAAAYQTSADVAAGRLHIYSVLGHFLGPAKPSHKVKLYVTPLRDTRSFATRFVRATQTIDGQERNCMSATIDFIVVLGDRTVFDFSAQPSISRITHHSRLPTFEQTLAKMAVDSSLSEGYRKTASRSVERFKSGPERKFPPEGVWAHNAYGILLEGKHGQEHLPLADQRGFDYFRARSLPTIGTKGEILYPPTQEAANACLLALEMDSYMSFLPIGFTHQTWGHMAAASSLEFALRFHTNQLDMLKWHLREMRTITAGQERGYDESRLWIEVEDENGQPKFKRVATMNQATVLRGAPKERAGHKL
jgi:acyl-CoA thioesterase II